MNILKYFFVSNRILTTIFLFLSVHCFAGGIPKTMPDDFYIYYDSHLGYNSKYSAIDLSLSECTAFLHSDGDTNQIKHFSFTLTRKELSSLYDALFALKAFTLKSKPTKYGDRGGEKIEYVISGRTYKVNNKGWHIVIPSHLNHFIECIDLITACADRHRH